MKHTFGEWMTAVRPWSFPASAMPVVVMLGWLFSENADVCWTNGVWALLNIIIFHAAGNTWSDYFDFRKHVDDKDTFGVRTLTSGMFSKKEIFWLSVSLLAVAVAAGIGLLLRTGLPLLYIGIGGALCSVLYPFLKYRALGELVIFAAYAFLPALGTVYVATLEIDWSSLYIAVPVGLITVAILHCNNLRDIATDSRAKISTLAIKLGGKLSVWLYCFEIIFPFLWISGCVIAGIFPVWCLIVWLAAVPAAGNVRMALAYFKEGAAAIARLDEATAKLQLVFSLIFSATFFLAGIMA